MEDVNSILSSANGDFGYALRSARESKGLSISEVSQQLHLDEKVIYALENHQLSDLPEAAYVCGYIRNYARFMGIQAEPLITEFKKETEVKSALTTVNSIGNRLEKTQQNSSYVFILFLCVFFVFSGIYGWKLWNKNTTNEEAFSTKENTAEEAGFSLPIKSENENLGLDSNESRTKTTEVNSVNTQSIALTSSGETQVDGKANIKQAEAQTIEKKSIATLVENKVENKEEIKDIASASVPKQVIVNEIVEETILTNRIVRKKTDKPKVKQKINKKIKELYLSFSKDSWISIKDGKKKSLVYDLMRKGEDLKLKGLAPINVFLGDATGVKLKVDDKKFDIKPFINDKNIAKFKIQE